MGSKGLGTIRQDQFCYLQQLFVVKILSFLGSSGYFTTNINHLKLVYFSASPLEIETNK